MFRACILDIDGVLVGDIGGSYNLNLLREIQLINQKFIAQKESNVYPFITINSGRPHAYCEAVSQMIGNSNFFMFENGAGISKIDKDGYKYILDERIDNNLLAEMDILIENVFTKFKEGFYYKQPNKQFAKTILFKENDSLIVKIWKFIEEEIMEKKLNLYCDHGYNFININIKGIHKGTGLEMFQNQTNIAYSEMVGVGDSLGDKNFIEKCGFKACPSNADPKLKEICDYVSKFPDIQGTLDILQRVIRLNESK